MGFDAGKFVDVLDYDFTAFGGSKGVVPEPSDKVLLRFQDSMRKGLVEFGITDAIDITDNAVVMRIIAKLPAEQMSQFLEMQVDALAEFCQGTPTLTELQTMPVRVRNAFAGWLMGKFENPESLATATNS